MTTAILVHRTKEKKSLSWEFDSIIMQNRSDNLLLFGAPTWPSYHVIENYLLDMRAILKKFNCKGEVTHQIITTPLPLASRRAVLSCVKLSSK